MMWNNQGRLRENLLRSTVVFFLLISTGMNAQQTGECPSGPMRPSSGQLLTTSGPVSSLYGFPAGGKGSAATSMLFPGSGLFPHALAVEQRTALQKAGPYPQGPVSVPLRHAGSPAFFCRLELKLEQKTRFPVKFRLGEVQYVERMEGKLKVTGY